MANMTAQLVRNLVASKLNCDPCNVILSGEISPDYEASSSKHTSFDCDWEHSTKLYAWFPNEFKEIPEVISKYVTNGHTQDDYRTESVPLYKVEGMDRVILFVEEYTAARIDWNREIRVYKPADFAGKLAQVTEEDITRWENWLNS